MGSFSCGQWDIVPQLGIEPGPTHPLPWPILGAQSFSYWDHQRSPPQCLTFNAIVHQGEAMAFSSLGISIKQAVVEG